MSEAGFVLLHRTLLGHHAFRNDAEAMAFAWLTARASWRPTRVRYKGHVIDLRRGEVCISVRDMAEAHERPKGWVERLLTRLKNETMIETRAGTAGRTAPLVISITNYDTYQANADTARTASRTPSETASRTGPGQDPDTEQQGNKGTTVETGDKPLSLPARKRASRLPEDWKPEKLDRATNAGRIARERGTDWMTRTFEAFENYWRAKSGKDATKLDWQRTWSNWVVTQHERDSRNGRQPERNGGSRSGHGRTVDAALELIEDLERERQAANHH